MATHSNHATSKPVPEYRFHCGTSVRNAIECLLQNDSESALVYALVHDPEFRFAFAILKVPTEDKDHDVIIKALVHIFEPYEEEFHRFMRALMVKEMVETKNWNDLFRAKSAVTVLVREYTYQAGNSFLYQALHSSIEVLWDVQAVTFEVNPHLVITQVRCDNKENANNRQYLEEILRKNRRQLHRHAQQTFDKILAAASCFPPRIAKLYSILHQEMMRIMLEERKRSLSSVMNGKRSDSVTSNEDANDTDDESTSGRRRVLSIDVPERRSFSDRTFSFSDCEFLITEEDAQDEVMIHLGGFVFLRYICPALLMPHKFDLTPDKQIPSKAMRRNLVLIAKILQSLASAVEYAAHESYMLPFNAFLSANRSRLIQFYHDVLDIAKEKTSNKEKDKFGWTRSSMCSNTSTVDDDFEEPAGDVDLITCFRASISKNLDDIARDMEQEHIKLEDQRRRAVGAPVTSIVAQRQMRQRRARKQGDGEGDSKEIDPDEGLNNAVPPSSKSFGVEDLEQLVQHQKKYEAKVKANFKPSREGLELLLNVNDEQQGNEWKRYKTHKTAIQVFRRTPSANGFVEMKACIIIKASSHQVFRYLRSLETMSEWDGRASNIEKVEPVSSSSVLLYRSHSKFSLWPSWLVKPRDSCDLHTFVSDTGRPQTFAVVMESVPNPDYPELKGVVRMSYATGGLLMESCTGPFDSWPAPRPTHHIDLDEVLEQFEQEPANDNGNYRNSILESLLPPCEEDVTPTTRLTCVVRADFKGSLPRSLAEGICYRQVLSVESVKKHVEAELSHTRSQWV